jgi:hypothetical protein
MRESYRQSPEFVLMYITPHNFAKIASVGMNVSVIGRAVPAGKAQSEVITSKTSQEKSSTGFEDPVEPVKF